GSRHISESVTFCDVDRLCAECNRLLDDYAEAIKTHIRITGQKQLAAMQHRSDVLNRFRTACNGETSFQESRRHARESVPTIRSGEGVRLVDRRTSDLPRYGATV